MIWNRPNSCHKLWP